MANPGRVLAKTKTGASKPAPHSTDNKRNPEQIVLYEISRASKNCY